MKSLRLLFLILIGGMASGFVCKAAFPENLPDALKMFDELLIQRDAIVEQRYSTIDSIKRLGHDGTPLSVVMYCERVADAYSGLNPDSAAVWYRRGEQAANDVGDTVGRQRMRLKKLAECMEIGLSKFCLDELYSIEVNTLPEELQTLYYEEGCRMLGYFAWCTPIQEVREDYLNQAKLFYDGLNMTARVHDTARCHFHKALFAFHRGDVTALMEHVRTLVEMQEMSDVFFSQGAMLAGTYYLKRGLGEKAMYYLLLAAISDMSAGRVQSHAIEDLCGVFYDTGDVARAMQCMQMAVENVIATGARMRMLSVINYMPPIMASVKEADGEKLFRHYLWNWAMLCVIILLVLSLVIMLFRMRSVRMTNLDLKKAGKDREAFMTKFLELSSMNLEKFSEFQRMALRKIKAGQYQELSEIINSGKYVDEQTAQFYEVLDEGFMRVYPSFVSDLNKLLRPEAQISIPHDGRLNAELRILAVMRLGIDDSSMIARFLGLSLNTVYTYRNRMRGRAVNRESFEQEIMTIGSLIEKPESE